MKLCMHEYLDKKQLWLKSQAMKVCVDHFQHFHLRAFKAAPSFDINQYCATDRCSVKISNMQWTARNIFMVVSLVLTATLPPIGWLIQKYWIRGKGT